MTAPTHSIGGMAAGVALAVCIHANAAETAYLIGISALGSLLPDIDNPHSRISFKWRGIRLIVSAGQSLIRCVSCLLPRRQKAYVRSLIGHRGLTHSLLPVILPAALNIFFVRQHIGYCITAGLAGGILSHLLLDILSGGVPLFMPFSTRRICLAHIKTGGIAENIFRTALIIFVVGTGLEEITIWLK